MAKKQGKVSFIKEIKEQMENNERQVEFKGINFTVKNYLPILDKLTILEIVVQNCMQEKDNGIKFYNSAMQEPMLDYLLVKYYSSLAITDEWEKMYNLLCESGIMEFVICEIPTEELDWFEENLESRINSELEVLDRENQFGNLIKSLVDKIDKSLPSLLESIEKISPENMDIIKKMTKNQKLQ